MQTTLDLPSAHQEQEGSPRIGSAWPPSGPSATSTTTEAAGAKLRSTALAWDVTASDAEDFESDLYGYSWMPVEGAPSGALCSIIPKSGDMPWIVDAAITGDVAALDVDAPDAHEMILVDMKDGLVKMVRHAPIPSALGRLLKGMSPPSEGAALAKQAYDRFCAQGRDAWEEGARWVWCPEGFQACNAASRAIESGARPA